MIFRDKCCILDAGDMNMCCTADLKSNMNGRLSFLPHNHYLCSLGEASARGLPLSGKMRGGYK